MPEGIVVQRRTYTSGSLHVLNGLAPPDGILAAECVNDGSSNSVLMRPAQARGCSLDPCTASACCQPAFCLWSVQCLNWGVFFPMPGCQTV